MKINIKIICITIVCSILGTKVFGMAAESENKVSLIVCEIMQNYDQPGFMMSNLVTGLTKDQVKKIVTQLDAEAQKFVGAKTEDQAALKVWFENLPENFFKMLLRKAFSKIYSQNIDDVMIDKILDGFGTDQVNWGHCNITSLDGYQDLLMVWNTITPITSLNLFRNHLTTAAIPQLPALQGLFISFNKLTTVTLPATMPALRLLYLTGNRLPAVTLPTMMPALKELSLSYNELTIVSIPQLPALESLDLTKNKLTTIILPEMMPALEWLYLSDNPYLSREEKARFKAMFRFAKV